MKKTIRKIIVGLTGGLLACLLGTIAVSASEHILYGDMDESNRITVRDALEVMLYVAKDGELSEEQLIRADVDADGDVDSEDGKLIFLCAAEMRTGFRLDEITANGTMWIASDSIAQGLGTNCGWGQVIDDYLVDGTVVNNTAYSGKTAKAFTETRNYSRIMDNMKPGDILIISFGHNEASGLEGTTIPNAGTENKDGFKYYLKYYYIEPALRCGVQPILMSPVARGWGPLMSFEDQFHYQWAKAAKELAEEYQANGINLHFIDMFHITTNEYLHMGKQAALEAYHKLTRPDSDGSPQYDTIHYKEEGARFAAQIILCEMKELGYDYAKYINEDVLTDPRQYDGVEFGK